MRSYGAMRHASFHAIRAMLVHMQHATKEEISKVEIAYELLLAHNNEDLRDQGLVEDFVEQCEVFTNMIEKQRQRRQQ